MSKDNQPNPQIELAKKRNRAAAERTLMAWIRTSLSLITFGFGIDRIVSLVKKTVSVDSTGLTRFLSLLFIGLGILAMVAASYQHQRELRDIQEDKYIYTKRLSLGLIVAWCLVIIGIVAFMGILIQIRF